MALVPLNQIIHVEKTAEGSDGWGNKLPASFSKIDCRVDESSDTVMNREGKETVTSLKILLDASSIIGYEDTIHYTDEFGKKTVKKPTRIETKRDFAGNVLLRVVYV